MSGQFPLVPVTGNKIVYEAGRGPTNSTKPIFSYKRGDHDMSDPSTREMHELLAKRVAEAMLPDYSDLATRMGLGKAEFEGLLNPPDGSYPHIEFPDLSWDERKTYAMCLSTWAVNRLPNDLSDFATGLHAADLNTICDQQKESPIGFVKAIAESLARAIAVTKREEDAAPKPARPGHLMAEGRAMSVAREAVANKRYSRKVTFSEPVNVFTMLHGDAIAVGGDMLTAVTVTGTEEHQIKDFRGGTRTVYTSWAVSI